MRKLKTMILAMVFILAFALSGCSGKKEEAVTDTAAPVEEVNEEEAASEDVSAEEDSNAESEDTSLEDITAKGEFILGLDDSFPPMGFVNEDQEIVGFDIDVAKEVASRMGVELKLQPISWSAKEQELATKNIDCIWNGFTKNPDREKNHTLSDAYMRNTQVAVVLTDSGISSLEDLAGKSVVIQNGSTASDAMDANEEFKNSLGELILVDDNVQALMDLAIGGSDAVVLDEVVARYYTEGKESQYTILENSLAEEEYVIGFRKGEEALKNKVNEVLLELAEDGTLAKISETWFGKDITVIGK